MRNAMRILDPQSLHRLAAFLQHLTRLVRAQVIGHHCEGPGEAARQVPTYRRPPLAGVRAVARQVPVRYILIALRISVSLVGRSGRTSGGPAMEEGMEARADPRAAAIDSRSGSLPTDIEETATGLSEMGFVDSAAPCEN